MNYMERTRKWIHLPQSQALLEYIKKTTFGKKKIVKNSKAYKQIRKSFFCSMDEWFPKFKQTKHVLNISDINGEDKQEAKNKHISFVGPHSFSPSYIFYGLRDELAGTYNLANKMAFIIPGFIELMNKMFGMQVKYFTHRAIENILPKGKNIIMCPDGFQSIAYTTKKYVRVFTDKYKYWIKRAMMHGYDIIINTAVNGNLIVNQIEERYLLRHILPISVILPGVPTKVKEINIDRIHIVLPKVKAPSNELIDEIYTKIIRFMREQYRSYKNVLVI